MSRSFEDRGGRSPLIIKDLDLYPQPPTNTRSPTLNSEEPLIGLTLLAMWMALRASASDPDPSGKDIIGFFPLFALVIIGPVNLAGGIAGIVGAVGKPKTLKLNWLGILLNASPYVIFTVLPFLLAILFGR